MEKKLCVFAIPTTYTSIAHPKKCFFFHTKLQQLIYVFIDGLNNFMFVLIHFLFSSNIINIEKKKQIRMENMQSEKNATVTSNPQQQVTLLTRTCPNFVIFCVFHVFNIFKGGQIPF